MKITTKLEGSSLSLSSSRRRVQQHVNPIILAPPPPPPSFIILPLRAYSKFSGARNAATATEAKLWACLDSHRKYLQRKLMDVITLTGEFNNKNSLCMLVLESGAEMEWHINSYT
jgi:hypothetical protein